MRSEGIPLIARHLLLAGRILVGLATVAFGVQYLIYGKFVRGLPPIPGWLPGGRTGADVAALVLLVLGAALVVGAKLRVTSVALGLVYIAGACLHLTHMHDVLTDGNGRTGFLEPLAIGAALWAVLAVPDWGGESSVLDPVLAAIGRVVFALTLLVFGWQHFIYRSFLISLIPKWLHAPMFWVLFTGAALVAVGLAILARIADGWAGLAMATMFVGWLLVLHGPRIAAQVKNGDEWSSGLVALAFCGASLWFAAIAEARKAPRTVRR